MERVELTRASYEAIAAHAVEAFPAECCGFVVRRNGRQEVVRVTNIQDQLHALDRESYPRTAATAYSMGPDQLPVVRGHDAGTLRIEAVYHSHPQHDAYFSPTDRRVAAPDGAPTYPGAAQIVISVIDRAARAIKAFRWDESARDFVDAELRVGGPT